MSNFVLIHGGFHSGTCFELVSEQLSRSGHHVLAPDLPSPEGAEDPATHVDLAVYTGFVIDLIERMDEPVILVGHSMGGITISSVAEARPDLVQELVYLAAMMLPSGQSVSSIRRRFYGELSDPSESAATWRLSENGSVAYLDPNDALSKYYNRTDEVVARRFIGSLRGQPLNLLNEPVHVTPERWGSRRRTYILALDDRGLPPPLGAHLLEVVGADRVEVIDTDHSPFASNPDLLTKLLLKGL
jgi:pimeloyl-ACP methyl ester carboxylesterase